MIRLLFFITLVLVLGFGFAWLADRPGDMVITWQGRQIEMSLMVAVTVVVSLVAAVMLTWWIIRTIFTSPHVIRRYFRANKRDRGYQALSTGLIAAGAGDSAAALKMLKRSQGLLSADQEPLLHLLDVQAAMIEGRNDDARKMFQSMSNDAETKLLGLRGLYLEARRQGALEAARQYADEAADLAPQLAWAADAALSNRTIERKWDEALRLIERQQREEMYDKKDIQRKKAVLLTARAMDQADADPQAAWKDGLAALRLVPNFVPAALVTAKSLFREEKLRRGSRLLEAVWRENQHPDIAETYVAARIGDTPADELKRAQRLESIRPHIAESLFAVGRSALNANKLKLARAKAEAAARLAPREGIYLLLADIEEADTGDQGRVRFWLSQALKAPRDPAWTADGFVSEEWAPVSPVTGQLDAFEWKVPVAQLGGHTIEHGAAAEAEFDRTVADLPAMVEASVADRPNGVFDEDAGDDLDEAAEKSAIEPKPIKPQSAPVKPTGKPVSEATEANKIAKASAGSPDAKTGDQQVAEAGQGSKPQDKSADAAIMAKAEVKTDAEQKPQREGNEPVSKGEPKAVTEATGAKDDENGDEEEAAFLNYRPDDPGVDETAEPEPARRFKLF